MLSEMIARDSIRVDSPSISSPPPLKASPSVKFTPLMVASAPPVTRITRLSPPASSVTSPVPSPSRSPSMMTSPAISSCVPSSAMVPPMAKVIRPPATPVASTSAMASRSDSRPSSASTTSRSVLTMALAGSEVASWAPMSKIAPRSTMRASTGIVSSVVPSPSRSCASRPTDPSAPPSAGLSTRSARAALRTGPPLSSTRPPPVTASISANRSARVSPSSSSTVTLSAGAAKAPDAVRACVPRITPPAKSRSCPARNMSWPVMTEAAALPAKMLLATEDWWSEAELM